MVTTDTSTHQTERSRRLRDEAALADLVGQLRTIEGRIRRYDPYMAFDLAVTTSHVENLAQAVAFHEDGNRLAGSIYTGQEGRQ